MYHVVCDLLGIEKNKYGLSSRALEHLLSLILNIQFDGDVHNEASVKRLESFLKENGLYDNLKETVKTQAIYSPSDNTIYNFVLARYFERIDKELGPEFFESWIIPAELLSENVKYLPDLFFECKYIQKRQIPREVLKSWRIAEENFIAQCKEYHMELLDAPFTDDPAVSDLDYVKSPPKPIVKSVSYNYTESSINANINANTASQSQVKASSPPFNFKWVVLGGIIWLYGAFAFANRK
jgi:hypothetical protein